MNLKQALELGQKEGFDNVGECVDHVLANWKTLIPCMVHASESIELIFDTLYTLAIPFETELPAAIRKIDAAASVEQQSVPSVETVL